MVPWLKFLAKSLDRSSTWPYTAVYFLARLPPSSTSSSAGSSPSQNSLVIPSRIPHVLIITSSQQISQLLHNNFWLHLFLSDRTYLLSWAYQCELPFRWRGLLAEDIDSTLNNLRSTCRVRLTVSHARPIRLRRNGGAYFFAEFFCFFCNLIRISDAYSNVQARLNPTKDP